MWIPASKHKDEVVHCSVCESLILSLITVRDTINTVSDYNQCYIKIDLFYFKQKKKKTYKKLLHTNINDIFKHNDPH